MESLAQDIYSVAQWVEHNGWLLSSVRYSPDKKQLCLLSALYLRKRDFDLTSGQDDSQQQITFDMLCDQNTSSDRADIGCVRNALVLLMILKGYPRLSDRNFSLAFAVAKCLHDDGKLPFVQNIINFHPPEPAHMLTM